MNKPVQKRIILWGAGLAVLLSMAGLVLVLANLNRMAESGLRRLLGSGLEVGRTELHWNRIAFHQVRIGRGGGTPPRLEIRRVTLTPSFRTIFSERLQIGSIELDEPRLTVEIAPDGSVVNPFPPSSAAASPKQREGGAARAVTIGDLSIHDGEVTIRDRHVAHTGGQGLSHPRERYHLVRFRAIKFRAGPLNLPDQGRPMSFTLTGQAPEHGTLRLAGQVTPATLDGSATLALRQWDITRFRPYFQRPGDMTATRGGLSADSTIVIRDRSLHAPGSIRLKDLSVAPGSRGRFLGLPSKAVIWFLKNNRDELVLDFTVSGSLNNPRFTVRQTLTDQIGTALAHKMGVPFLGDVGKGLVDLGGKGIRGVKGIFDGGRR